MKRLLIADFGHEFGLAPCTAGGTVICSNGGSAADDLPGNDTSSVTSFRNGASQFDDSQCKGFRALFQFRWIHTAKLKTQSTIGNQQSAIWR